MIYMHANLFSNFQLRVTSGTYKVRDTNLETTLYPLTRDNFAYPGGTEGCPERNKDTKAMTSPRKVRYRKDTKKAATLVVADFWVSFGFPKISRGRPFHLLYVFSLPSLVSLVTAI